VKLQACSDIVIEGIVMRDPDVWCCSLFGCRQATIQNIKLIGLWRYNSMALTSAIARTSRSATVLSAPMMTAWWSKDSSGKGTTLTTTARAEHPL